MVAPAVLAHANRQSSAKGSVGTPPSDEEKKMCACVW